MAVYFEDISICFLYQAYNSHMPYGYERVRIVHPRIIKFGIQIGSDWPKMGQIWDFLRSVSVHFGSPRKDYANYLNVRL